jgi:protein-disulfide isomerase-like protein with CxxC motif
MAVPKFTQAGSITAYIFCPLCSLSYGKTLLLATPIRNKLMLLLHMAYHHSEEANARVGYTQDYLMSVAT